MPRRARPGRRLLATTVVVVALLASVAAWLAVALYRTAEEDVADAAASNAAAAGADASLFLRGRLELLSSVAAALVDATPAEVQAVLARLPSDDLGLTGGLAWVGADGAVVALNRGSAAPTDPAVAELVRQVRAQGRAAIAPTSVTSPLFDEPVVLLAAPGVGAGEEAGGVLLGGIGLAWLDRVVDSRPFGAGAARVLVDASGHVVAGSSYPAGPLDATGWPALAWAREESTRQAGRREAVVSGVDRRGSALDGTGEQVVAFGRVSAADWLLLSTQGRDAVLGEARRELVLRLGGVVAAAGLALVGAALVARRLDRAAARREQSRAEAVLVAQRLQEVMLATPTVELPGFGVGVCYLPAEAPLEVGGDWYDLVSVPSGRVALLVGDVVGRGLDAAAVMGQLRSAARAFCVLAEGPAAVLAHLDDFVRTLHPAVGTTVCVVELDPLSGALQYACAGHPAPLVVEADRSTRFLSGGRGAPLGVPAPRHQATAELPPGASLVLCTDGLIERRGESLDDGFARLARTAAAVVPGNDATTSATELVQRLAGAGEAGDDACALVVRRTPAPQVRTAPGTGSGSAAVLAGA